MGEFELIAKYFQRPGRTLPSGVALGIGDDCALLAPRAGQQLAVSSDMLVEGRHFLSTVSPERLGHKALAVNLSDLAACGAKPLAFTLALALPRVDEPWLEAFSRGLFALADQHGIALVGGDTTCGPLNICITVFGEVGPRRAHLRSGAQVGDDIYVSGEPGWARLALDAFRGGISLHPEHWDFARERLERPQPRVALGQALRTVANSCIDVSDGLLGDLGHILRASQVGAVIDEQALIHQFPTELVEQLGAERLNACVWAGGDDYELVFTADPTQRDVVAQSARSSGTLITHIGRIVAEPGCQLRQPDGSQRPAQYGSFDHFAH